MLRLNIFFLLYFNTRIIVVLSAILSVHAFRVTKIVTQLCDHPIIKEVSCKDCFASNLNPSFHILISRQDIFRFLPCLNFGCFSKHQRSFHVGVFFKNVISEERKHDYFFFPCVTAIIK